MKEINPKIKAVRIPTFSTFNPIDDFTLNDFKNYFRKFVINEFSKLDVGLK